MTYIKEEELEEDNNEIYLVELKPNPPYTCALLKSTKKKDTIDHMNKKIHSFGINQVNQIFDILLKDRQIKLFDSHRILSKKKNAWLYH